jgi:hypothetical protein
MKLIRFYEDQTYFAWIGKFGSSDPYYYRIHSPVTFNEVSQVYSSLLLGMLTRQYPACALFILSFDSLIFTVAVSVGRYVRL